MAKKPKKPKIIRQIVGEYERKRGGEIMEKVKLIGKIHLVLRDKRGRIKEDRLIGNTIADVGKAELAGLMITDVGGTAFDYIALGTGTPTATALGAEATTNGGARRGGADVAGTRVTTDAANDTGQLQTTFTFTGALALTEAGIFNAAAAGTMLASQSFSVLNVADTDTLAITWRIKIA